MHTNRYSYTFSGNLTAVFVVKFVYCEFFNLYIQTIIQIVVDINSLFRVYTQGVYKAYLLRKVYTSEVQ